MSQDTLRTSTKKSNNDNAARKNQRCLDPVCFCFCFVLILIFLGCKFIVLISPHIRQQYVSQQTLPKTMTGQSTNVAGHASRVLNGDWFSCGVFFLSFFFTLIVIYWLLTIISVMALENLLRNFARTTSSRFSQLSSAAWQHCVSVIIYPGKFVRIFS